MECDQCGVSWSGDGLSGDVELHVVGIEVVVETLEMENVTKGKFTDYEKERTKQQQGSTGDAGNAEMTPV